MQHFLVCMQGTHWKFTAHGVDRGPFKTQEDALREAIFAARRASEDGEETEVLVQDETHTFRPSWRSTDVSAG